MRVEITRQDIDHCKEHGGCPMKRACERALGGRKRVQVNTFSVWWSAGASGRLRRVRLPREATDFVRRWDNHREAEPLSFELDVPGEDRKEAS